MTVVNAVLDFLSGGGGDDEDKKVEKEKNNNKNNGVGSIRSENGPLGENIENRKNRTSEGIGAKGTDGVNEGARANGVN